MWAHNTLAQILFWLGEFALVQDHLEQALVFYDPQKDNPFVSGATQDAKVTNWCSIARVLWMLGYPDQALQRNCEALTPAQELSHPYSLASALFDAVTLPVSPECRCRDYTRDYV